MMILCKMFSLWLLMAIVKWSNGIFYGESTHLPLFNDDMMFDLNDTIANNEDNNVEKFIEKRSTVAVASSPPPSASLTALTSSHQIDGDNEYTYLNIGVLMASHLGNIKNPLHIYPYRTLALTKNPLQMLKNKSAKKL